MWDGSSLICYDDLKLDKEEVMELSHTDKSHPNLDISEDEMRGNLYNEACSIPQTWTLKKP